MNCQYCKEYIIDYLEKILPEELNEAIEKHLGQCKSCAKEKEEYEIMFNVIDNSPDILPGENVKNNFYKLLNEEKKEENKGKIRTIKEQKNKVIQFNIDFISKIAAVFIILITGFTIGWYFNPNTVDNNSGNEYYVNNEMETMKESMLENMLSQDSPSKRLKALQLTNTLINPDNKLIDALSRTLNEDNNLNVRKAAAKALAKFGEQEDVRKSLISSLNQQDDPGIQIELINILVALEEKRAIHSIENLISNKNSIEVVKNHARMGLSLLEE